MYEPSWDYHIRTYIDVAAEREGLELSERRVAKLEREICKMELEGRFESEKDFWEKSRELLKSIK